jgi:NADPH:quinone reductase-like Zn-dependent oxidoreductase
MVGLTAWQGLVEGAGVGVGDRVLVLGAGGGVGHIAVQIARAKGADVVGSASASKAEFVLSLGAEQVVDYADPDYLESAGQFDIVFDTIGGETAGHALDRLVPGGRFVTIREQNNDEFAEQVRARGNRFVGTFVRADGGQLAELAALADSGALRVEVSAIYPFEQLAQAQDAVAAGRTRGKVVVTV